MKYDILRNNPKESKCVGLNVVFDTLVSCRDTMEWSGRHKWFHLAVLSHLSLKRKRKRLLCLEMQNSVVLRTGLWAFLAPALLPILAHQH